MNESPSIYVFDRDDNLLTTLNNDSDDTCRFTEPYLEEELNTVPTFEFTVPTNHDDAKHIKEENQVAVKDIDGVFRLFVIKNLTYGIDEKMAECESGMIELIDTIIEDRRPQNTTAQDALSVALEKTRYEAGQVDSLGQGSTNYYYITPSKSIEKIVGEWGGETRDRLTFSDEKITSRFIDLLTRRGEDTGHRFETGIDVENVEITIQSYPKTALYARGKSLETDDGGYTRRITFEDVEWSVANGDPVDKPLGQNWVGDPDALAKYGRLKDGERIQREGTFEDSEEEDPERLLEKAWNELQTVKEPNVNIKLDVITLEHKYGYEHKKVRLGDTTYAYISELDLQTEQRIFRHRYNILDLSDAEVEMGEPILRNNETERLDEVESKVSEKAGIWDQAGDPSIDDDNFSDNEPPVPSNFNAKGGFAKISLTWDYEAASYIAACELYASQSQDFTPDSSNLIWRGRGGGFVHELSVNQQWYYRIRTVNTHGTPSPYSNEVSAQTLQVNADTEIEEQTITKKLLAAEAIIDEIHVSNGAITNAKIANLVWDKAQGGTATLGGSENGNGVLDLRDTDGYLIIRMNSDGIELFNGSQLIGNGGVLSKFVTQMPQYEQVGVRHVGAKPRANASFSVPDNFTIVSAELKVYALPTRYESSGNVNWTNVDQASITMSESSNGYYDYVEEADSGVGYVWEGNDWDTNDLFGISTWTPPSPSSSDPVAEEITADIQSIISPGNDYNIKIESTSNAAPNENTGFLRTVVTIIGYQQ
ncbi:phage tail spike protein [Alkalibacillus sp. S2W]|uniref:phage tail spike protein n=1 Tax=Alkalibacillus sp. S2W TaxID=3386553 RepID=UPI00398CE915